MNDKEFAILHDLDGTQFLVDSTYDHEEEQFKLSFKFWASEVNGYATVTLSWSDDKEDKFKDPAYCKEWVKNVNQ